MRLRTSPQSNQRSAAMPRRDKSSFNEAADFAAEQPDDDANETPMICASMRLRTSPQSNAVIRGSDAANIVRFNEAADFAAEQLGVSLTATRHRAPLQ